MLTLIIFTLLLNITYTSSTENKLLSDTLKGFGIEHKEHTLQENAPSRKQDLSPPAIQPIEIPHENSLNENAGNHVASQLKNEQITQQGKSLNQQNKPIDKSHPLKASNEKQTQVTNDHDTVSNNKASTSSKQNKSDMTKEDKSSTLQPQVIPKNLKEEMQSGALLRGFYVFVGLSVVIMMYFIFRSYR